MVPKNRHRSTVMHGGRGPSAMRGGRERPVHYVSQRPRTLLDRGLATTGWTAVANCVISTAAIATPEGPSASLLKIQVSAVSTNTFFDQTWSYGSLLGKEGIEFDLYVEQPAASTTAGTGNSGLQFDVQFRDSGATNNIAAQFQATYGWQRVRLCKADFSTVVGGGAWDSTTFTVARWKITGTSGITPIIHIRNFGWMGWEKPSITLIFDDIGISVHGTAFPLMAARGIVGTNAVISDAIGQSAWSGYDRCSAAQIIEMNRAGWSCSNHSQTHGAQPFLTGASQATCFAEIDTCRSALISNRLDDGLARDTYCSPYGEWAADYYAGYDQVGSMKLYRGTVVTNSTISAVAANSNVMLGSRLVPCFNVDRTYAAATVTGVIDRTILRGGSLVLLFHHIVTTPGTSIEYSTANFTTIVDHIKTKLAAGLIDCINLSQLYDRIRL